MRNIVLKKLFRKFINVVNEDDGVKALLTNREYWGRSSVLRILETPGTPNEGQLIFEASFICKNGHVEALNQPPENPRTRIYISEDLFLDLLEGKDPREVILHEEFYAFGENVLTDLALWRKMFEPYSYLFEKIRK